MRRLQRIDIDLLPPCEFVTALVKLAMVSTAEWYCKFVTYLLCVRARAVEQIAGGAHPTGCDRRPVRTSGAHELQMIQLPTDTCASQHLTVNMGLWFMSKGVSGHENYCRAFG